MTEVTKINILIVDDHQIVIDGIKSLLKNENNIEVIGEVLNAKDAMNFIASNKVSLVITDINMPGMTGVELTDWIKKTFPEIKVLILTMRDDFPVIKKILEVKASGYLLKNTGKEELMKAIRVISNNGTYFDADISKTVMEGMGDVGFDPAKLTLREIEIVRLIVQEYLTKEIAETLKISKHTVETHRKHIFRKTGTKSVIGLLKYAYEHKLMK